MSNSVKIPLDVLAHWYEAAQKTIECCNPNVKFHPYSKEREERRKRSYEMAVKTVEVLKNVDFEIEITESEETNNE